MKNTFFIKNIIKPFIIISIEPNHKNQDIFTIKIISSFVFLFKYSEIFLSKYVDLIHYLILQIAEVSSSENGWVSD